ncbi:hypothetical protein ANCCEY_00056 [Ancylostoma ceylanicum]|uniref:Uncharacterized protein n=1 Tax=Ancylostoma ceylanicum TaxID=53326 RepID=A0A0D6M9N5_9BILA|nr:hypothetical protein ANCCEY_00056 [Ancylostoma ceylanicum]
MPNAKSFAVSTMEKPALVESEVAPQDSDTDSGICADSEQPSPRQLIEIPLIFSSNSNSDYLTPESYSNEFSQQLCDVKDLSNNFSQQIIQAVITD